MASAASPRGAEGAGMRDFGTVEAAKLFPWKVLLMARKLRKRAIDVLLWRGRWALNEADWVAFVERLDEPPPPNAKLKALLARSPVWDRQ